MPEVPRRHRRLLIGTLTFLLAAGVLNIVLMFLSPGAPFRSVTTSGGGLDWGATLFLSTLSLLPAGPAIRLRITRRLPQVSTLLSIGILLTFYGFSAAGNWYSLAHGTMRPGLTVAFFIDHHTALGLMAAFIILSRRWVVAWTIPLPKDAQATARPNTREVTVDR
ncbi:hypothetical protein ACFQ3B_09740 [Stackebrandtia endophytica]